MPIENTAGDVVEKNSLSTPSNQPGTLKTFNGSLDSGYYPNPKLPPKYQICFGGTPSNAEVWDQDIMEVCMCSFFGIAT